MSEIKQATTTEIIRALETLLIERIFWTAGREEFDRQGWSCLIDEETAIRDINYRDAKLYNDAGQAIRAAMIEEIENRRAKS